MPGVLQGKLVAGAVHFLRKIHYKVRLEHNSLTREIEGQIQGLFNRNWAALRSVQKYGIFEVYDNFRFVGGKRCFDVLVWCADKHIRLSASELACLQTLPLETGRCSASSVYETLKSLTRHDSNAS